MTAKTRLGTVLAAVAVVGASAGLLAIQATEKPVAELDGVWVVQSAERAGKPMQLSSFAAPGAMRITFRGTKATLKGFNQTPTGDEVTYDAQEVELTASGQSTVTFGPTSDL